MLITSHAATHDPITAETHLGHPTASQSPDPFISSSSDIQGVKSLIVDLFEESPSSLVSAVSSRFLVSVFGNMVGERGRRCGDRVTRELTSSDRSNGVFSSIPMERSISWYPQDVAFQTKDGPARTESEILIVYGRVLYDRAGFTSQESEHVHT